MSLTQSAVSQHIAALEREIGTPVVERGSSPVALTEAGHALTRHTTAILARLDGAEQELGEIAGRRRGRLRFGSFPTALATLAPPSVSAAPAPGGDADGGRHHLRLLPRLEGGEIDLGLIYEHEALPEIASRHLQRTGLFADEYRAVLPARHRLTRRRRPLDLADLATEPWIGGAPDSAWFRVARHACREAGFTPRVGFASDDYIAVQALVAAGLGVSLIPGLAVGHPLPGLEVRALAAGAPVREISAARPRDGYDGPAVVAMLDSLTRAARGLAT